MKNSYSDKAFSALVHSREFMAMGMDERVYKSQADTIKDYERNIRINSPKILHFKNRKWTDKEIAGILKK